MSHVFIVALEVEAADRAWAQGYVMDRLAASFRSDRMNDGAPFVECWWVAEDDRADGSDCDSAVFVRPGCQREAAALLRRHGLTSGGAA